MNRAIKFRAWDKHRKKLGPAWVISEKDGAITEAKLPGDIDFSDSDDIVLMQFTGLYDKNGKEIYEGDILAGHSDGNVRVEWHEKGAGWRCVFLTDRDGGVIGLDEMCVWFGNPSEVIGNIYENPDLLK